MENAYILFIFLIIAVWVILCIVIGNIGKKRNIGFAVPFFLSFFLSPLIGLIVALTSDRKSETKLSPTLKSLIKQGNKFWRKGEIENAIEKYKEALKYTDKAPYTNYKLAKLYSLKKESTKSLNYLSNSIKDGYKNFDKINSDKELEFLRETPAYKVFVTNKYRLNPVQSETKRQLSNVQQLEKLNSLFEKGVINKEEFEIEKKNILSNNN